MTVAGMRNVLSRFDDDDEVSLHFQTDGYRSYVIMSVRDPDCTDRVLMSAELYSDHGGLVDEVIREREMRSIRQDDDIRRVVEGRRWNPWDND